MLRRLFSYRKAWLVAAWVTWTLFSLAPIAVGALNKAIFDRLDPAGGGDVSLVVLFAALAAATVSMAGLAVLWFWVHSTFEPMVITLPRVNFFDWVLARAGRRGERESPVTLLGYLRDDAEEYAGLVNEWYRLAGEAAFVAVALVIMLRIDPLVTAVTFVPLAGVVLFTHWMRTRLPRLHGEARRATTATTDFIGDVFGAVQAVKVAGAERGVVRRFEELNRDRGAAEVRSLAAQARIDGVSQAAIVGGQGLVLVVSAAAMFAGRFTVGDFVLFVVYLDWMLELPRRVGRLLSQIKVAGKSKERLQGALDGTPVEVLTAHRPIHLSGPLPAVAQPGPIGGDALRELEVDRIGFEPGMGDFALRDVSLRLQRGTVTVVTGEVGAGKSTLLELILGLREPTSGSVRWNGEVVDDPPGFMTPPRVAYKPQLPRLFSESLEDTIRLGADGSLQPALRRAAFERDVAEMPAGLATVVGPRGHRLSGGQRQRASAARMFVRPAELYVIDDLSSALDEATEQEVWAGLDAGRAGEETYLVVSHSAAALRRADEIVVLRDGRVEDRGTLAELAARSPTVRRIVGHAD